MYNNKIQRSSDPRRAFPRRMNHVLTRTQTDTCVSQLLSPRWTAASCCRLFAASCYSHLLCERTGGRLADLSVHYGNVRCELSPVQRSRVIKWLRKRRALPPTRTATLALWPLSLSHSLYTSTSCLPTTAPLHYVSLVTEQFWQQFKIIKPLAQLFSFKYENPFLFKFTLHLPYYLQRRKLRRLRYWHTKLTLH